MVSPYAAGLGGFMSGFAGGMKIGKDLREQYDQHQAQKEREVAIAEARQQYQQQVQQQADAIEGLQQPAQPTYQNETVSVTPVQERKVEANGLPTLDGWKGAGKDGILEVGNINLNNRPRVKNADGSISTVRSMSIGMDGKEYLIPTVSDDGRILSDQDAIEQFKRTGKHLGAFDTPENATAYANKLHDDQERQYVGTQSRFQQPSIPAALGIGGAQTTQKLIETPAADTKAMAATRQNSMKIAQGQIGSERDAIDKAISSRMRNFYMDRGDVAMADKWEQYAETREGKRQMKAFGEALRAYNLGNTEGFVKSIMPVLEDAYGDGFKMQKYAPVKDKDGNVTGYNFEIRNTRTGEVTQNNIGTDQLYQVGMSLGTPEQAFQRWMKDQQEGRSARQKAAIEIGKQQAQTARELALERERQGGRVQLEGMKQNQAMALKEFESMLPGPLGKKLQDARANGASEEQVKQMLQSEVEGNFKKTTDPTERKAIIMSNLSQKYVDFAGNPTKTPQEIGAMADEYIKQIYGDKQPQSVVRQPAATAPRLARDKVTGEIVQIGPDGKPVR